MKRQKGKKQNNDFWNTIHDIRNMTASHLDQNKSNVFKLHNSKIKQKGTKIPLPLLNKIRKKAITTLKMERQQKQTEDIQYDSLARTKDTKFLDKLKVQDTRNKNNFVKNKYKYKDMKSRPMGSFKNGALKFSSREITRIKRSKK